MTDASAANNKVIKIKELKCETISPPWTRELLIYQLTEIGPSLCLTISSSCPAFIKVKQQSEMPSPSVQEVSANLSPAFKSNFFLTSFWYDELPLSSKFTMASTLQQPSFSLFLDKLLGSFGIEYIDFYFRRITTAISTAICTETV